MLLLTVCARLLYVSILFHEYTKAIKWNYLLNLAQQNIAFYFVLFVLEYECDGHCSGKL